MNIQEGEVLEIELKKNTEILENIFERFNLKVLNIAYSGNINDGSVNTYIELVGINGNKLKLPRDCYGIDIKINFYENGNLLCSNSTYVEKDNFDGYDTIQIYNSYNNLLSRATSARIYAVSN